VINLYWDLFPSNDFLNLSKVTIRLTVVCKRHKYYEELTDFLMILCPTLAYDVALSV